MGWLQDQLDQISEQTRRLVQAERLQPSENAVAELFSSGIEQQIIFVGELAPEFALPDSNGRIVRSTDLLALGPVIVTSFAVGGAPTAWRNLQPGAIAIPSCASWSVAGGHLSADGSSKRFIAAATPAAVSYIERCRVRQSRNLSAAYTVPAYHQQHYRSILVNIPFMNGDPSWRLPLPATFLLRPRRKIAFAQAYADFRVRPEPEEVLAALDHESLGAPKNSAQNAD